MLLEHSSHCSQGICNPRCSHVRRIENPALAQQVMLSGDLQSPFSRMSAGLQILLEHYTHCSQGICNISGLRRRITNPAFEHYTHYSQGICNPRLSHEGRIANPA